MTNEAINKMVGDKMRGETTVLYHDDNDGFAAAYACWRNLQGIVHFIPVNYNQDVPPIPANTRVLYIVDFSYDRETCDKLAEQYKLVVIDHHKTAAEKLKGAPYAVIDTTTSGAELTWQFFTDAETPWVISYAGDYDMWRFFLPESGEVNLYLSAIPRTFEEWDTVTKRDAIIGGTAIKMFRDRQVERRMKEASLVEFAGVIVPAVNATDNISVIGNELCKAYPDASFALVHNTDAEGNIRVSLRSVGEFDVSEVAKRYGGGGHRNAAGFTLPG